MNTTPHKPDPLPPNTTPKGRDFDPHLREVIHEIRELLEKHRVAGYVVLQSPHYAEYSIDFPDWACVQLHPDGLRIYSKREQFPSLEAQKECTEVSTGIVLQLAHILEGHARNFAKLGVLLGQKMEIIHVSKRS